MGYKILQIKNTYFYVAIVANVRLKSLLKTYNKGFV